MVSEVEGVYVEDKLLEEMESGFEWLSRKINDRKRKRKCLEDRDSQIYRNTY